MSAHRLLLAAPLLAALAGCPEPVAEPPDEAEITDAGTVAPAKPTCTAQAAGTKYGVCESTFQSATFQRTDRYELTGDLFPIEPQQRHRGERFVVVGGLD